MSSQTDFQPYGEAFLDGRWSPCQAEGEEALSKDGKSSFVNVTWMPGWGRENMDLCLSQEEPPRKPKHG